MSYYAVSEGSWIFKLCESEKPMYTQTTRVNTSGSLWAKQIKEQKCAQEVEWEEGGNIRSLVKRHWYWSGGWSLKHWVPEYVVNSFVSHGKKKKKKKVLMQYCYTSDVA